MKILKITGSLIYRIIVNSVSGSGKSNWIGLNDGFYNSLDGIFEWTDGMTDTVIVATNMTSMSCVLLDHNIGEYTATSCDHTHEFLCRREYGGSYWVPGLGVN